MASTPITQIIPQSERFELADPSVRNVVFIDQDNCTGDGLCEQIEGDVFECGDDGLFYVKDADGTRLGPMATGARYVPEGKLETAIEAAEECPGECIYVIPEAEYFGRSLERGFVAEA